MLFHISAEQHGAAREEIPCLKLPSNVTARQAHPPGFQGAGFFYQSF
jgi:hypothetical protein